MGKSVEHFLAHAQVAEGANRRLIDALANAPLKGEATQELYEPRRNRNRDGTRVAASTRSTRTPSCSSSPVLSGEFAITGFRNRDLQAKPFRHRAPALPGGQTSNPPDLSCLIAKLRGHRLIAKV